MSNFKGIKQVLFSEYSGKTQAEKIGYLWLVRNGEGSELFDIYFGSRKYGSNDLSVISKLQDAFGGFLSADGAFTFPTGVEFTSFDDTNAGDFGDVLIALDAAIKANQIALANVYTKTEVEGLIGDVEALLNNYATGVTVTVGESTYTGTLANNVVNVDLSTAFAAAGSVKDVTVDGTSVMSGTTAVIDLSGKANVGDAYTKSEADAKFLTGVTIPEYEIMKQDTPEEGYAATYYLAKDGVQTGVKINTTLDQVLQSSSIQTVEVAGEPYSGAVVGDKYVKFVFQNNDTPQYLPVKDLVDVYTGSNSIEVSENNVISVKEVDATQTVLSKDIEVNGGPLADDANNWPDAWKKNGKNIIPSGATMEAILTNLFLKVTSGTVEFSSVTWSPALDTPSVSLNSGGTIEVGSKVKVTKLTGGSFNKAKRSVTLTATKGYFSGDTYNSATSKTFNSAESVSGGTSVLTCTWNTNPTEITVNSTELTVKEGTNTIVVKQTGVTASVTAIPEMTVYASTNTQTKLTDTTASKKQVATFKEAETGYTRSNLTATTSASVTAYYPIYTNGKQGSHGSASSETSHVADDGTKLALVADGTIFYVDFAPMIDGGTGYRLLVQKDKKITHAIALNPNNGNYEVDMKNDFVKAAGTVTKKSGGVDTEYVVYEAKGTEGANNIQIKIG